MKDTLCHDVYIQSLEVGRGEVPLELLPKVKERVETLWDQDVLQRGGIKRKDVNMWPISSCRFYCRHLSVCTLESSVCSMKTCGRI